MSELLKDMNAALQRGREFSGDAPKGELCAQEESARLVRRAEEEAKERAQVEAQAKAAVQDAREALARESEVQQALQAADAVRPYP